MQNNTELEKDANVVDNTDYIEAIKTLKENSVDKAKYDALKADNKRLLDAVINGSPAETEAEPVVYPSRAEGLKKYRENNFSTDLDYWKNFLELRNATIREYGKDPLVTGNYGVSPSGEHIEAEYGEAEAMENLCEDIQALIDEFDGNPTMFRLKLQSSIK